MIIGSRQEFEKACYALMNDRKFNQGELSTSAVSCLQVFFKIFNSVKWKIHSKELEYYRITIVFLVRLWARLNNENTSSNLTKTMVKSDAIKNSWLSEAVKNLKKLYCAYMNDRKFNQGEMSNSAVSCLEVFFKIFNSVKMENSIQKN